LANVCAALLVEDRERKANGEDVVLKARPGGNGAAVDVKKEARVRRLVLISIVG